MSIINNKNKNIPKIIVVISHEDNELLLFIVVVGVETGTLGETVGTFGTIETGTLGETIGTVGTGTLGETVGTGVGTTGTTHGKIEFAQLILL